MLNPKDCIQFALNTFSAMPPKGQASIVLDALVKAGYVVVPKDYIIGLVTDNAAMALEAVERVS